MYYTSIFLMFFMLSSSALLLRGCTIDRAPNVVFPKREHQFTNSLIVTTFIIVLAKWYFIFQN